MISTLRAVRGSSLSLRSRNYVAVLKSPRVEWFVTSSQLQKSAEKPVEPTPEPTAEKAEVRPAQNQTAADRDLCVSVLASASSKRDVSNYVRRFTPALPGQLEALPPIPSSQSAKKTLTFSGIKGRDRTHLTRPLEDIHVGLVKIRGLSGVDDVALGGLGRTICLLKRLGLFSIVVVDEAPPSSAYPGVITAWRALVEEQADRVLSAVERERGHARRVDGSLSVDWGGSDLKIAPDHVIAPLSRGVITILCPIAYNPAQCLASINPNELVLRLTTLLSTYSLKKPPAEQSISLDRVIFLDPLGGIPSVDRPSGAHVFINLEQEYAALEAQLSTSPNEHHLASLSTLRRALAMLPHTSSGVITTPSLAAAHNVNPGPSLDKPKRSKNPLIHNLLTDKPLISSSLPVRSPSQVTLTTLLKHGTPIKVHPAGTKLTDASRIDLQKLVALIEDSFRRKLDVNHYISRINDNIAAVIVAGDYEGAAIVTWEYPEGDRTRQRVCYLDKFAVLRKSQGQGGVADVVFKCMVEGVSNGLFEGVEGIVWRSRKWNPVNKWYFERAKGTWKIPETEWTMFWTTQDAEVGKRRLKDYTDICRGIEPSLLDE